jgi:GxxExxY protein
MNTNRENILYQDLSYKIVGLAMEGHRKLGYGFLEKVYENAMMVLFQREGIRARQQISVKVYFEGVEVGYYVADIVVEDKIIIELKAAENLVDGHRAQTLNYLKATNMKLALLLNFGKQKLQYERLVN